MAGEVSLHRKTGSGAFVRALALTLLATSLTGSVLAKPQQVTGVAAEVRGYSKIHLSWEPVSGAFHYKVHRGVVPGFALGDENCVMVTAATAYQDMGLDPDKEYHYRIMAVDRDGLEGTASPEVGGKTLPYSPAAHPRLEIFEDDIPDLRNRCKNLDPWRSWYAPVKKEADAAYDRLPSSTAFHARSAPCVVYSVVFLVEGSDRYYSRLKDHLLDCPTSDDGENELSVGSTLRAFCTAYDVAHPYLSEDERANVEKTISFWGEWLSARTDRHFTNWRVVAAQGLLAAGLVLDKPLWVEQSIRTMQFVLSDLIVGSGSYMEGSAYHSYMWGAGQHMVHMLKNAGIRDYYRDPRFMDAMTMTLRERLPHLLNSGYEDSPYVTSIGNLPATVLNCPMPALTRQMKTVINALTPDLSTHLDLSKHEFLLYTYYTDTVPADPVIFTDWADAESGLGYMGTGMGDEDFMLSFIAKPYAMTYANGHQRPDDLSFELMAYGAFLVHGPGYMGYAVEPLASYAHDGRAYSTAVIGGQCQDVGKASEGIQTALFTDVLGYIEGTADNNYAAGAMQRGIVFVKPTAGRKGYYLLADAITPDDENGQSTWYLHGGLSDDLVISGRDATWTVPRWVPTDSTDDSVKMLAHVATPTSVTLDECRLIEDGADQYEFYAYVSLYADRFHTKYIGITQTGACRLLTVLYPRKAAWPAPPIEDIPGGVQVEGRDVASIQRSNEGLLIEGVSHDARLMLMRKEGDGASFFFVQDGGRLDYNRLGFTSDGNVQMVYDNYSSASALLLHMKTRDPHTALTVRNPSITGASTVQLDGEPAPCQASDGSVAFAVVGAGYHRVNVAYGRSPVPTAPTGLQAEAGTDRIRLSWEPVPGAVRYRVMRSAGSGGHFAIVDETTGLAYTDDRLSHGATYYYRVHAANGNGEGSASPEVGATTVVSRPAAPSGLKVTRRANVSADEPDYLELSWTGSAGAKYYTVKKVLNSERTALDVIKTGVSHSTDALQPVSDAEFVVTASNEAGESDCSNPASLGVPVYPGLPVPPAPSPAKARPAPRTFEPAPRPAYGQDPIFRLDYGKDAFVRDGQNAGVNYGGEGYLAVSGSSAPGRNSQACIRFALDRERVTGLRIERATLKVYCRSVDGPARIKLCAVADDSWEETALTWNDRPSGTPLVELTIDAPDQWYAFDVTDYVRREYGGDRLVSFLLLDGDGKANVTFGAKEGDVGPTTAPLHRPVLEILTSNSNTP